MRRKEDIEMGPLASVCRRRKVRYVGIDTFHGAL